MDLQRKSMESARLIERVASISDEDFFKHSVVSRVLSKLPTLENSYNNAKQIYGSVDSEKEERIWLAHENLWALWGSQDIKEDRLLLKDTDYVMYKKLTSYFCKLTNQYSKVVKEHGEEAHKRLRKARRDAMSSGLNEFRQKYPDINSL